MLELVGQQSTSRVSKEILSQGSEVESGVGHPMSFSSFAAVYGYMNLKHTHTHTVVKLNKQQSRPNVTEN